MTYSSTSDDSIPAGISARTKKYRKFPIAVAIVKGTTRIVLSPDKILIRLVGIKGKVYPEEHMQNHLHLPFRLNLY